MKYILTLACVLGLAACADPGDDPGFNDRLARVMMYRSMQQPTYQMPIRQTIICNRIGDSVYCN